MNDQQQTVERLRKAIKRIEAKHKRLRKQRLIEGVKRHDQEANAAQGMQGATRGGGQNVAQASIGYGRAANVEFLH